MLIQKTGFTTNVDGSEYSQVNIQGLEGYVMHAPEKKFHLETCSSEESKDE